MTDSLGEIQIRTFERATRATREAYPPANRLSGDQLADYLDRRAYAVVSSTRSDGRPHATLTSFVRRGTSFWLPVVAASVRERNVRAHPWLVLVVSEGDRGKHVAVIVEGPASVARRDDAPAEVAAAVVGDWISAWLRLNAERVLSYAADQVRAADPT